MCITIIGSLNYDLVTYTDRLPNAGETFKANKFETHIGGKGLNQTIAVAKLSKNMPIKMLGHVGNDTFGDNILGMLSKYNDLDLSDVQRAPLGLGTGVATIIVDQGSNNQNRILITEGANILTNYTAFQLDRIFPLYGDSTRVTGNNSIGTTPTTITSNSMANINDDVEFIVLQNEIPNSCFIIEWMFKYRSENQIVFNPSPFNDQISSSVWNKRIDILIVNEVEAIQVLQANITNSNLFTNFQNKISQDFIQGYREIATYLHQHFIKKDNLGAVIITLGAKGCIYLSNNTELTYKPSIFVPNEHIVDTTGAGDTFLGACISQLAQGATLDDAIHFALIASSIVIQKKGASQSIPSYEEVMRKSTSLM
ncbi:putative ribokinase SCDLUD_004035 [Saccharomycodes ludwigii]|uniref:putative ribokinase n=1 Tax=Saccharomycodes ludwigii TaxID=36035 RepID=UPI001E835FB8|nr:hypothetical protein SCDLUD_004035 [Saccharomycodes ludwigii]KAH3899749.1 hypothetical protein SCDLUD_004035 [Saccharomycodes ludwigii]